MDVKKLFAVIALMFLVGLGVGFAADTVVPEYSQRTDAPFRLFRTSNMWTFIKLDTANGRAWITVWDLNGNTRGTYPLNPRALVAKSNEIYGRFTLYATTNIYNFILLDQFDARTWQLQWSSDGQSNVIVPIMTVGDETQ